MALPIAKLFSSFLINGVLYMDPLNVLKFLTAILLCNFLTMVLVGIIQKLFLFLTSTYQYLVTGQTMMDFPEVFFLTRYMYNRLA